MSWHTHSATNNMCKKYKLVSIIIDDDTVLCTSDFFCFELKIWLPPALAMERRVGWKESWSHRNRGSLKAWPRLLSSLHGLRLRGVKSLSCLRLWMTWFISWLSGELISSLLLDVSSQRLQLSHLSVPPVSRIAPNKLHAPPKFSCFAVVVCFYLNYQYVDKKYKCYNQQRHHNIKV